MSPAALYSTCILGAVGLYLLLRPGRRSMRVAGVLLAGGALAWMLVRAPFAADPASAERPEIFFVIFAFIAVAAAVRMITHSKPIYSALYFILVVLSSAGLFLLLGAEFMAFALVIVYAGAILITYVFVLMLAQQGATEAQGQPEYDRLPREPLAACIVGFAMIALFGSMLFDRQPLPELPPFQLRQVQLWQRLEQMPVRLREVVMAAEPRFDWPPESGRGGHMVIVEPDGDAFVRGTVGGSGAPVRVYLPDEAMPENVQMVGLDLVAKFPVSLELAGVILLMAMFGAVVLARKQVELSEDEMREAAGLPRYAFEEEEPADRPGGSRGGGGGA